MMDWPGQDDSTPVLIAQAPPETATHTTTGTPAEPAAHGEEAEPQTSPWAFLALSGFSILVILLLAIISTRRMRLVPRGLQNVMEMLVESVYGIPEMVMGPRGRQYAPFIATFFIYILVMNLVGLIPIFKAPTASLSVTLALGAVAFVGVQYFGFRAHGISYLKHFLGPVPWLAFLILPLELISELIRPISLAVRLYGNINGEEQVIAALANKIAWPVAVLLLPLQILTIVLQALVFTLLVTVYISLATEKHEGDHAEHAEASAH